MKFDVVVNPAGGGGQTKRFWQKWEPYFNGQDYTVHFSSREEGITEIVRKLTSRDETVNLIIVGGDGSLNETVNGIADFSNVRLGILPCGSAMDLAKDIVIAETKEQIQQLLKGETVRSIDVGEAILHDHCQWFSKSYKETENEDIRLRFNVSCGIGWDAEICHEAEVSPVKPLFNKLHIGKLTYIVEAIHTIFAMTSFHCGVMTDAGLRKTYDQCVFCAVMNHKYEGGGFMFGPHAANDDGILDLCTVNNVSPLTFFRMIPSAYKGKQFESNFAFETRDVSFRFQTDQPVWVHIDGEPLCKTSDLTVHLLKEKLNLLF